MKILLFLAAGILLFLLSACISQEERWEMAKKTDRLKQYEDFLKAYPDGSLADSAKIRLDYLSFEKALSENLVESYRKYLDDFTYGMFADSARYIIELIYYNTVSGSYNIPLLSKFISARPQSPFVDSARANINLIVRGIKPQFRMVKYFVVECRQTGDLKDIDLKLKKKLTDILTELRMEVVYDRRDNHDCILTLRVYGNAVGASYWGQRGGYHYTGANVSGSITLDPKGGSSVRKNFSGRVSPASTIFSSHKSVSDAPFRSALETEAAMTEKYIELLGDCFGVYGLWSLLGNSSQNVRLSVIKFAGKTNNPAGTNALIKGLSDLYNQNRAAAAEYVGNRRSMKAVKPLLGMLEDDNYYCRQNAVEALGKIGDNSVLPEIVEMLDDKNTKVRNAAGFSLNKLGWEPVSETEKVLYCVARQRWSELPSYGRTAVLHLLDILDKYNKDIHKNALEVLGRIKDTVSVKPLIKYLKNNNYAYKVAAIRVLEKIGDRRCISELEKRLHDKYWDARQASAKALDGFGWTPSTAEKRVLYLIAKEKWSDCVIEGSNAVKPLIGTLRFSKVHDRAENCLVKIGEPAIDELINYLDDKNNDIKRRVEKVLEKITGQNLGKNKYAWRKWYTKSKSGDNK